ncbi:aspartate kinase [Tichowtungia aerotolerans]|uniref:Aspartokinase n=1 Tax=Tichowtungia aerotolerans TaxID=2697043 RepID=A0A6P1M6N0_9BACT|nr:aspartate kinase [Tichowtungia aerotolerans]QHI69672.1 aspartate kinase [Tichowtungia aerotolerans]
MKIVKFGGSSVANAAQISKIIDIVTGDVDRRIVVVSAPGKRNSSDIKVTDLLIALANTVLAGNDYEAELSTVVGRYAEIQRDLNLSEDVVDVIEADLRGRIENRGSSDAQFMDSMKASGEDNNAKVIAEAFTKAGFPAEYVNPGPAGMLLSDEFGNAEVLPESFEKLATLKQSDKIQIFPGFFGETKNGEVATFPRGGSDITGAILAAAVNADVYENFTDVDSVCAMDPRVIDNPPAIDCMTYREMRELSYAGFGVFHDEAIVPAVRAQIPICIKNTNNPSAPGTMVVPQRSPDERTVVGISSAPGFCSIYIDKYMMNREVGFGRRLLSILEEEGVSFEHTPSGIDNISVIMASANLSKKEETVVNRIKSELKPDAVTVEHGLSLVMVVGEGMQYTPGLAAKATGAFSSAGVNLEMINQGASEISMMFAVKDADREKALRALGSEFFGV